MKEHAPTAGTWVAILGGVVLAAAQQTGVVPNAEHEAREQRLVRKLDQCECELRQVEILLIERAAVDGIQENELKVLTNRKLGCNGKSDAAD